MKYYKKSLEGRFQKKIQKATSGTERSTGGNRNTENIRHFRKYIPIRTNPEEDALQIHTDSGISGENFENKIRRSNRNSKKLNKYGTVPYTRNFWG